MKMDYLIPVRHKEFVIIHSRVVAPVGINLKVAVTAYYINGEPLVAQGLELLAVVMVIGGDTVFFHTVFLGPAQHLARAYTLLHGAVGGAAHAYGFNAEGILKLKGFFELAFFEIIKADVAPYADKAELIQLCFYNLCIRIKIAGKLNAVIADLFDIFKGFEECFAVFNTVPYGIDLNCNFHNFTLILVKIVGLAAFGGFVDSLKNLGNNHCLLRLCG